MKTNYLKSKIKVLSMLLLLCVASSCIREHPVNLTVAKDRVALYHEQGHYNRDMKNIISDTLHHFKHASPRKNATVIFDIDETVLSGYADEKSISFGYIPKLSHEWILSADAPAIKETKRLYNYLVAHGFKIIFITGRKHNEYDATIKNLKHEGFTTFEKLIVRQPKEIQLTARDYKSTHRKKLSQEGYRIIGNIGDQDSDLTGGNSGYAVKLPNYRYLIS